MLQNAHDSRNCNYPISKSGKKRVFVFEKSTVRQGLHEKKAKEKNKKTSNNVSISDISPNNLRQSLYIDQVARPLSINGMISHKKYFNIQNNDGNCHESPNV